MLSFEALPDDKRRKIMNSAMAIFAKNGYKKTAVDDIVALAEISKGSIFYYFGSKKKFYLYLYEYSVKLTNDTVLSHVDRRDNDFFSRVNKIMQIKLCVITDYPDMYAFSIKANRETDLDVVEDILRINRLYRADVMTYAIEGINRARFKSEVYIDDIVNATFWIAEGFLKNITCKTESDIIKHMAEFGRYIKLLERSSCK
ncbi:MAG: TetR/AcrR family transcriptional regulator [Clostridia bacterium]